jgi:hypothetical protein
MKPLTAEEERALRFLLSELNAPEFIDKRDEFTQSYICIASIMNRYASQFRLSKEKIVEDFRKYLINSVSLCVFCPLDKKGVYSVPGGFMAGCEGSRCEDAIDNAIQAHHLLIDFLPDLSSPDNRDAIINKQDELIELLENWRIKMPMSVWKEKARLYDELSELKSKL